MIKKLQIISLIFIGFISLAFIQKGYINKGGKTIKTQSHALNKVSTLRLNNVLKGINNFLVQAGINYKFTLDKTSTKPSQNNTLLNLKKGYNLPSFESLQEDIKEIKWNSKYDVPRFISVKQDTIITNLNKTVSEATAENTVMNFLISEKSLLRIDDPQSEFSIANIQKDNLGMTHIRYKQTYKGIEVWAKDIYVHLNRNGEVVVLNGEYAPTPKVITNVNYKLTGDLAIESAKGNLKTKTELDNLPIGMKSLLHYYGPSAKKIIWFDNMQVPHLVWLVEIRPSIDQDWYYFVDADNGTILNSFNNICYDGPTTGSGTDLNGVSRTFGTYQVGSTYYMIDASQPMYNSAGSQIPQNPLGAIVGLDLRNHDYPDTLYFVTSTNNQYNDPASVSANYNAIQTYKYYYQTYNRNSIDDSAMTIYSIVHVTLDGQGMDNAYWNGLFMCYGDGDQYFKPLAGGLDVAAHEMTHGVTQHSANLVYQNQSGALNESISDVFGALVDSANWTMGETIVKDFTAFPTGALRDMSNPHNGGYQGSPSWQPAKMSEFVNTSSDNGGVHTNSGIPNHAFYVVATTIGRHKAGAIWYRALTKYLTRSAKFIDARIATEQAAKDLYGDPSPELDAVKVGWNSVEIYEGSGSPPPPSTQLIGQDWILALNTDSADPNSIYMVNPTIQSNSDLHPLSTTGVSNRPAVSDTSGVILFIDSNHNLRGMYADPANPQEQIIDTSGVWGSVAIGPGVASIALTTDFIDTTIYYLDLINQTVTPFKIKSQSFDGPDVNTALYADAMSFDPTGQYLLFDAYNEVKNNMGGKISFWNINLLDIKSGQMLNVFPSLSSGESVGNPSFSKTSFNRFTFDDYSDSKQTDYILTADFNSGNIGIVAGPLPVIGYPTYSKDDKTIAYHSLETYQSNLYDAVDKMPLESDMLNGTGSSQSYLIGATYPVWFVIGSRVTSIDEKSSILPQTVELEQNYPNPFNPTTIISYKLAKEGLVTLKIYDVLGREISTLVHKEQNAGQYYNNFKATNLPSGIYIYQLRVNDFVLSKKMILLK